MGSFLWDFYNRIKNNLNHLGGDSFLNSGSSSFKFKKFTLYKSKEQMLDSEANDLKHLRKNLRKKDNQLLSTTLIIAAFFVLAIILGSIFG